jgi:hypothetical protein
MTVLTGQRESSDCVLASIASYCGTDYERVWEVYHKSMGQYLSADGIPSGHIPRIAKYFGRRFKMRTGRPHGKSILIVRFHEKDFTHSMACGDSSWLHAVYFDGVNIFDPLMSNTSPNFLTTEHYLQKTEFWYKHRGRFL